MHLNVKYQQNCKYPINEISTTFQCVGFVGLKWEIVQYISHINFHSWVLAKFHRGCSLTILLF